MKRHNAFRERCCMSGISSHVERKFAPSPGQSGFAMSNNPIIDTQANSIAMVDSEVPDVRVRIQMRDVPAKTHSLTNVDVAISQSRFRLVIASDNMIWILNRGTKPRKKNRKQERGGTKWNKEAH